MGLHKSIIGVDMHVISRWVVADAAARAMIVPVMSDVGKVCFEQGTRTAWLLMAYDPVEWKDLTASGVESHDELSGVTADQHHGQQHAIDGGDHTGSLGHAALSGVSADQHHGQVHAIDGGDHSGSLGHGALSGVAANQHHDQQHALGGADHTVTALAALNALVSDAELDDKGARRRPMGFQRAVSLTLSQTTSDTWQEKLKLTTDDLELGTFVFFWSMEVRAQTSATPSYRVQFDDTDDIVLSDAEAMRVGCWHRMSGFFFETDISGVHEIDVDYHSNSPQETRIRNVRLMMWRAN